MKEVVLNFGEQGRLIGIVSVPDRLDPDSPAVLLPNTGLEHRVGPNRLHVHLSRALADAGFATLRLDLGGHGDSVPSDGSADPSRDLSAAMDILQARGFGDRFAVLGLCSGAHDAHLAMRADRRLIAGAFIDGYLFPTPRFYLTYLLQRATDPARILRKLLKSVGSKADRSHQSPIDLDYFRQPTKTEMQRDLAAFMARGLILSYIYTGQVQHRYNYAGQMEDAFPELRRYSSAEVRYLVMADHTFSQATMRSDLVEVVVSWMRRCVSSAPPLAPSGRLLWFLTLTFVC